MRGGGEAARLRGGERLLLDSDEGERLRRRGGLRETERLGARPERRGGGLIDRSRLLIDRRGGERDRERDTDRGRRRGGGESRPELESESLSELSELELSEDESESEEDEGAFARACRCCAII